MALRPKNNPKPAVETPEVEIIPPEKSVASSPKSGATSSADHIEDAAAEIHEPGPEASADTATDGDAAGGIDAPGDASSYEPQPPPGALPFDAWYQELFVTVHKTGGDMLGLQSPGMWVDRPLAPLAAKSLYRTCCRLRWLNFMLMPGTSWKGDAAIIAAYTIPLMMAIRAEVGWKAQQARQADAAESGTAGNGDAEDPLTRAAREDKAA